VTRKLSRTDVNLLLDTVLLLLFVALSICSVILEFVFPAGTVADGWILWHLSFNEWSRLRFALLATLAVCVLVHIMLHWSWVCGVVTSRLRGNRLRPTASHDDPGRTLWGVGLLILVINLGGAILAAATLTIQAPTPTP
jgi:hypothetical protein